jgi:hypothetical protein
VTEVLGTRALNRALLDRQLLLRRAVLPVDQALVHLVGLQAQAPLAPYVGLWSRLEGFRPEHLSDSINDRSAVRVVVTLRSTIHLFTADDALALRPILQTMLQRALASSPFARNLVNMEMPQLLEAGRNVLEQRPLTASELARELGARWPDRDATSLSYAVRYLLPLVQVPPRGIWGATGPARVTASLRVVIVTSHVLAPEQATGLAHARAVLMKHELSQTAWQSVFRQVGLAGIELSVPESLKPS